MPLFQVNKLRVVVFAGVIKLVFVATVVNRNSGLVDLGVDQVMFVSVL
jgi:hypothetical protein